MALPTLSEVKAELRFPVPDMESEHDVMLTRQIAAAVNFVSELTGVPLLTRTDRVYVTPPAASGNPVTIATKHVQAVSGIRYWATGSTLAEEPGGVIGVPTLGRRGYGSDKRRFFIYPPSTDWPEVLSHSRLEIDLERVADPTPEALAAAVIEGVRQLYDGSPVITPDGTIFALMWPWTKTRFDRQENLRMEGNQNGR